MLAFSIAGTSYTVMRKPCRPATLWTAYLSAGLNLKTPMAKKRTPSPRYRPDMDGSFRSAYDHNRRIVLAEGTVCALCGMPIDKKKRFPDPMSATVDHIIPVAKGGHPSDLQNLQIAHLICNQIKGSKTTIELNENLVEEKRIIGNRELPLSKNWADYGV